MTDTIQFSNGFGIYTVPKSVYIDPASIQTQTCPPWQNAQFVGYANVNNALAFHNWCAASAQAHIAGWPAPAEPKYWTIAAAELDGYWTAVTKDNTGFDSTVTPDQFHLPSGIGGPFIPA